MKGRQRSRTATWGALALDRAADAGVEVLIYVCAMALDAIKLHRPMRWMR